MNKLDATYLGDKVYVSGTGGTSKHEYKEKTIIQTGRKECIWWFNKYREQSSCSSLGRIPRHL